jgi:hypothetical protein
MRLRLQALAVGSALALTLALGASANAADRFTASIAQGYARILVTPDPGNSVKAQMKGGVLLLSFARKTDIDPTVLAKSLPDYIGSGRADADGKTLRFAISQPLRLSTSAAQGKIAIDLATNDFAGTPPGLTTPPPPAPIDINTQPPVKMRVGAYQAFTRLVFDWTRNVGYSVKPSPGRLTITFNSPARIDLSALTNTLPPWVKSSTQKADAKSVSVDITTDQGSAFHHFTDGSKIVLDVLAPKTDADAYNPPSTNGTKPVPTAGLSAAQTQAFTDAAAKLNKKPEPAPAPDPHAAPADPHANDIAEVVVTPMVTEASTDTQSAEGKLLRNGAVLTFAGAGQRGSAVFMRGLTAWIVLQGAAPLDVLKLKSQLGTYPEQLEAFSGNGVSVLRITLRAPADIIARAEGSALKVAIGNNVQDSPIAIGFARNQEIPSQSSLTTLLPGATKALTLSDPVAGDTLILMPSAAGRAMVVPRNFSEFTALKTASGLVIRSFVDDLSVTLNGTRVAITRPGGLALTLPSLPAAQTPAALAQKGEGPAYLDFEKWGKLDGGSFLATQRRLRDATTRKSLASANRARLQLARFYLANNFSAEALGLINLMQSLDPALQGDMQLQTMRAAANYMMGRYREAHNDIAGTAFDSDRHAALWRGLIDAALENWKDARGELENGIPVIKHYQTDWQARVRIALAQTALGQGHLEVADASLQKLPEELGRDVALDALIVRGRVLASLSHIREADKLFDNAERSGNDGIAAQAIYYRTNAQMNAGAITREAGIKILENLRFRWRGDALELKTLRKLGQLYFASNKWREGLSMLKVATQSFGSEDQARWAQDDMRRAFGDLYLRGKADKMPPIKALALFYDFIDLTPLGADGDEMIRKMADRLVAVDLLGPASDLLQYQIDKRLEGVARAQVATRLASVQLMDQKFADALTTLRNTRLSTLPDEVNQERTLLEARALAGLKHYDAALDTIALDETPEAARLRGDIYWESGNWAMAGQKNEEALGESWNADAPLSDEQRQSAMRAAVAYSLANDEVSLERLRAHFSAKMQNSPDGKAFGIVSQRIDLQGVAFRDAAAKVASVDTLQSFMKDFRKRTQMAEAN